MSPVPFGRSQAEIMYIIKYQDNNSGHTLRMRNYFSHCHLRKDHNRKRSKMILEFMSRKYEVAVRGSNHLWCSYYCNPESTPGECVIALEGACTADKINTEKHK